VLLRLDLLDRDGDRQGERLVEAIGDLHAVRVVHAEPGPRGRDHLGVAAGHPELVVQEVAAALERLALGQADREPITEEREELLLDVSDRLIAAADRKGSVEAHERLLKRVEDGPGLVEQIEGPAEGDFAVDLVEAIALVVLDPGVAREREKRLVQGEEFRHRR